MKHEQFHLRCQRAAARAQTPDPHCTRLTSEQQTRFDEAYLVELANERLAKLVADHSVYRRLTKE